MKAKIFLPTIFVFLCIISLGQSKLMSFNIRYDNAADGVNNWNHRKAELIQLLVESESDIIGIQEGLHHQVQYIDEQLGKFSYIGVGRDDGKNKGEYAAIFYNTDKFKLISQQTFWLSETPNKVSVGWDASMERIVTYGAFINKTNLDSIYVFNAHFDHLGKQSRKHAAAFIVKKIQELGLKQKQVIVMGDLNCIPQSKAIRILKQQLNDAKKISKNKHQGPKGTFNEFKPDSKAKFRIDYVFCQNLNVLNHQHINAKRSNGLCISDHLPILVEIAND